MPEQYKHRLSVEITETQYYALQKYMEYGSRRLLFGVIIDDLIALLETGGAITFGAILSGKIGLGFNNMEGGSNEARRPTAKHKPDVKRGPAAAYKRHKKITPFAKGREKEKR